MILAVVGLCGSGKSTVTDFFTQQGFARIYLGQPVMDELAKRGLTQTEQNEKRIRHELRETHGMAAMAKLLIKEIAIQAKHNHVVLESMYSFAEYELLKETFPNQFHVLAVHASPRIRKQRLTNRPTRPLSNQEVDSRDYDQIKHLQQAGPIARADTHIINESDKQHLITELRTFYENKIADTFK